jgi:hypothetical protein
MAPSSRPAITCRLGEVDLVEPPRSAGRRRTGQGGEGRRADGEALADGGGGVAHGVELVGALAHLLGPSSGHLGDAAGVVGDRAVGVDRELDAGGGQHAEGGDGDAVEAGEVVGHEDGRAEHDDRQGGREHAGPRPAMMLVAAPVSLRRRSCVGGPRLSAV